MAKQLALLVFSIALSSAFASFAHENELPPDTASTLSISTICNEGISEVSFNQGITGSTISIGTLSQDGADSSEAVPLLSREARGLVMRTILSGEGRLAKDAGAAAVTDYQVSSCLNLPTPVEPSGLYCLPPPHGRVCACTPSKPGDCEFLEWVCDLVGGVFRSPFCDY